MLGKVSSPSTSSFQADTRASLSRSSGKKLLRPIDRPGNEASSSGTKTSRKLIFTKSKDTSKNAPTPEEQNPPTALPSSSLESSLAGMDISAAESSKEALGEGLAWKIPLTSDPLEASSLAKYQLMFDNALSVRHAPDYEYMHMITIKYAADDTGAKEDIDDVKQAFRHCCGLNRHHDITLKKDLAGLERADYQILHGIDHVLNGLSVEHKRACKRGLLVVYYAGHGSLHSSNQDLWLGTGYPDEDLAFRFDVVKNHLLNPLLDSHKTQLRQTNLLFVLDCCHSGQAAKFRGQEYLVSISTASSQYDRAHGRHQGQSFSARLASTVRRLAKQPGALSINMAEVAGELQSRKGSSVQYFNVVGTGNILLPLSKPVEGTIGMLRERPTNLVTSAVSNPLSGRATAFPALPGQSQDTSGEQKKVKATITVKMPFDPTDAGLSELSTWLRSLAKHEIKLVKCQLSESCILILDVPYKIYKELDHHDWCGFIGLDFETYDLDAYASEKTETDTKGVSHSASKGREDLASDPQITYPPVSQNW